MNFTGRRTAAQQVHPLLAAMGLFDTLDELPVAIYVADERGTIVYRNKVNKTILRDMVAARGEPAVEGLRAAILDAARRATSYPHTTIVDVSSHGRRCFIQASISALRGGYLVNWRDVTAEQERISALAETADQLTAASRSFEQVTARLTDEAASVAARAETVSAGANQLSASIESISASTSAAANETATAVTAAGGANERISQLIESSTQVESVSKLINSIAEQTNLLALNATIESARAGEAGKGFAVVAGAVKDLAGRTSEATDRIGTTIQAIQSDSSTVASSITRIVDVIGAIEATQHMISGAVRQQSATAAEMTANVSAVADSAQSTAHLVDELQSIAAKVLAKSQELRDLV